MNTIRTRTAEVSLREDGIVQYIVHTGARIGLNDSREYVYIQQTLTKGVQLPVMTDLRRVKAISKDARAYLRTQASERHATATALVVNSAWQAIAANLMVRFQSPSYPVRLFTSPREALKWLKQFTDSASAALPAPAPLASKNPSFG